MNTNNTIKRCNKRDKTKVYEVKNSDSEFIESLFNNHMLKILNLVQFVQDPDPELIKRIIDFLDLLEKHRFRGERPRWLENAFRYLRLFFSKYPNINLKNCCAAYVMVKRIYAAVGDKRLESDFVFKPQYSKAELHRREIRQSVREVFQSAMACAA